MSIDPTVLALLIALISFAGIVIAGLLKIWQGTKAIHVLVNSNFNGVKTDIRMMMLGIFLLIVAVIIAVYKAIARLRRPVEERKY